MGKYIVKRLLMMIPVILAVAILIFTIMTFVPGNPASLILGADATEEQILIKEHELGLDQPYVIRLGNFLKQTFVDFDFGRSYWTIHLLQKTDGPLPAHTGDCRFRNVVYRYHRYSVGYLHRDPRRNVRRPHRSFTLCNRCFDADVLAGNAVCAAVCTEIKTSAGTGNGWS